MPQVRQPLALFVVTEDWYFCSHRLPFARALKAAGYRVAVATHVDRHEGRIRGEGFDLYPLPALRGLAAWKEPGSVLALAETYRRLRPDLIVHVALRVVVLGGLAAILSGRRATVNILTGMGYLFTSRSLKARILRFPVATLLRFISDRPGSRTVVQNSEDFESLTSAGLLPRSRTELVMGSGIDLREFSPMPEPAGAFTAAAVCRLLADKGVYDLVAAARALRARGTPLRIVLAGPIDSDNPTAVKREEVEAWHREGVIEWVGHSEDVRTVWAKAHVAVLPSHREGLPKALVEAAACGRPIVTTETTGCRETVGDGGGGILVPLRDPEALADALLRLSREPATRASMGAASRRRAEALFSNEIIVGKLMGVAEDVVRESSGADEAPGENLDTQTVRGFGDEWSRFDQAEVAEVELDGIFDRYFSIFPWDSLPPGPTGFDLGCGSGRWAARVAPRVGRLLCVDASAAALEVARRNLDGQPNCQFLHASVDALPMPDGSMDFGYSLGVLHHVPDTQAGLSACVRKLKPGAPFLLYLYYALDNRPGWYRLLWRVSDYARAVVSQAPFPVRSLAAGLLARCVYWPLARVALLVEVLGGDPGNLPLAYYRRSSYYTMATDSLDRFGTPLERRFSRAQICSMMSAAGLRSIRFREAMPFWVALGLREREPTTA